MGIISDLFDEIAELGREVARETRQEVRAAAQRAADEARRRAKEIAKQTAERLRDQAKREWNRMVAPVPADVQAAIDSATGSVPDVPYSSDVVVFLDRPLDDADFQRGWAPGMVKDHHIKIVLPSKRDVMREHRLLSEVLPLSPDIEARVVGWSDPNEPVLEYSSEIHPFINPLQDEAVVRKARWAYATVRGKQVRMNLKGVTFLAANTWARHSA